MFGSTGWFNKHGTAAVDVNVPPNVYNRLKGAAVDFMRRSGILPPKGMADITVDNWMRPRMTGCG